MTATQKGLVICMKNMIGGACEEIVGKDGYPVEHGRMDECIERGWVAANRPHRMEITNPFASTKVVDSGSVESEMVVFGQVVAGSFSAQVDCLEPLARCLVVLMVTA